MACQFDIDRAISPQYPALIVTQDGVSLCIQVVFNDSAVPGFTKTYLVSDLDAVIAADLKNEIVTRLSSGSVNMYKRSISISALLQAALTI